MDQVMSIEAALAVADEVSPSPARAVTALKVLRLALAHVGPGTALLEMLEERVRQVTVEGWTPEHDEEHGDGSLADAAACYALHGGGMPAELCVENWPWAMEWFKPASAARSIAKAGALLIAERERQQRSEKSNG